MVDFKNDFESGRRKTFAEVLDQLRRASFRLQHLLPPTDVDGNRMSTHGVRGIHWKHYKHSLPEHVYEGLLEVLEKCDCVGGRARFMVIGIN
jgi:hypothetical protein